MENRAHILVSVIDAFFLFIYTIWENLVILQLDLYLNFDDSLFKAQANCLLSFGHVKIVITRSTYIRIKCGQDFLMRQPLLHID